MPELNWTTQIHRGKWEHLEQVLGGCLGMQCNRRHSHESYQIWHERSIARKRPHEAVSVTLHWKDSRTNLCHVTVSSQEDDHPESTSCWTVSVHLRRMLFPASP